MAHHLSAQDEFERLQDKSTAEFTERILDLAEAHVRTWNLTSYVIRDRARQQLGDLIAGTAAVAEILARRRVRLEVDHRKRGASSETAYKYAADDQNLVPGVEPQKAIEDIVKRDPRLAPGYRRVQELLSKERAFAMAKSSDLAVTQKVQEVIANALKQGGLLPTVEDVIAQLGGWARAYGETVFRTNLSTAYANGRFMEAMDPDFFGFIVGLRRYAVNDVRTRPNHRKAHGLTAGVRDPIWLKLGVPAGYNCRCGLRLIDVYEARREGLMVDQYTMRRADWPAGAYNDDGFDNRVSFDLMGAL